MTIDQARAEFGVSATGEEVTATVYVIAYMERGKTWALDDCLSHFSIHSSLDEAIKILEEKYPKNKRNLSGVNGYSTYPMGFNEKADIYEMTLTVPRNSALKNENWKEDLVSQKLDYMSRDNGCNLVKVYTLQLLGLCPKPTGGSLLPDSVPREEIVPLI